MHDNEGDAVKKSNLIKNRIVDSLIANRKSSCKSSNNVIINIASLSFIWCFWLNK